VEVGSRRKDVMRRKKKSNAALFQGKKKIGQRKETEESQAAKGKRPSINEKSFML